MTTNPLDEIQARADAATEGPWEAQEFDDSPGDEGSCILAGTGMEARAIAYSIPYPWHPEKDAVADAEFIAHAREDVPKLVAALRAVEELCTTSEEHAEPYGDTPTIYVESVRAFIQQALDG